MNLENERTQLDTAVQNMKQCRKGTNAELGVRAELAKATTLVNVASLAQLVEQLDKSQDTIQRSSGETVAAINQLSEIIDKSQKSSDKLQKSLYKLNQILVVATTVGAIATLIMAIKAIF
ncbi:hypothetical protein AB6C71_04380 [Vibrio splendidus]